ncbi:MAG: UPF0280 family protein [Candidatus Omnitrophota bacterium]|nr:MAG: UPF0280 family protein [Candidatus Omnitrophota bacterium]
MYEQRVYRNQVLSKCCFEVSYKESDLLISADKDIKKDLARNLLIKYYREIEEYGEKNPPFLTSLSPLKVEPEAPSIVKDMLRCSRVTGVGPFAAVAGAVAFYVGEELLKFSDELFIENGGDIFLKINEDKRIGVYLGRSLGQVSLLVRKRAHSFGIASSSSFMGHSLNFGKAELVTVVAGNSILADGFATSLSNRIKTKTDAQSVLEEARTNSLIDALVVAVGGQLYLWGDVEIVG